MLVLQGAHLEGYLDGLYDAPPNEVDGKVGEKTMRIPNPEYLCWRVLQQQALGFLMTPLSCMGGLGPSSHTHIVTRGLNSAKANVRISIVCTYREGSRFYDPQWKHVYRGVCWQDLSTYTSTIATTMTRLVVCAQGGRGAGAYRLQQQHCWARSVRSLAMPLIDDMYEPDYVSSVGVPP